MNDSNSTWLATLAANGINVKVIHIHSIIEHEGEVFEECQTFGTEAAARVYRTRINNKYGRKNVDAEFIRDTFTINFDTSDV